MEEQIKHLKETYESQRNLLIDLRKYANPRFLRWVYQIQIGMLRDSIRDLDKILNSKTTNP